MRKASPLSLRLLLPPVSLTGHDDAISYENSEGRLNTVKKVTYSHIRYPTESKGTLHNLLEDALLEYYYCSLGFWHACRLFSLACSCLP